MDFNDKKNMKKINFKIACLAKTSSKKILVTPLCFINVGT